MRMSQRGKSAADLLDELDEGRLAEVLRRWGEVPRPRRQARAILAARQKGQLRTTRDLAELVARISPRASRRRSRIHPATLVFQALRIAVNEELDDLAALCEAVPDLLCDGGVVAIIAFHRLEDRIVKRAFERHAKGPEVPSGVPLTEDERPKGTLEVLTRRPVRPTQAELDRNPRARSARLRAGQRRARADGADGIARRGVS
jgi:16S rRNA (cytosine1402-N4)-methyltransferase